MNSGQQTVGSGLWDLGDRENCAGIGLDWQLGGLGVRGEAGSGYRWKGWSGYWRERLIALGVIELPASLLAGFSLSACVV